MKGNAEGYCRAGGMIMHTRSAIRLLIGLGVSVLMIAADAEARGPLLASQNIAVWDGPETKIYYVNEKIGSFPKCRKLKCKKADIIVTRPKIDLKRHQLTAHMYGPDSISNPNKQLREISTACLVSGLVLAGIPAVATAPIASVPDDLIKAGVKTCLAAQNAGSQLVAPGFEVTIEQKDFFEH